jgi:hypothetical protein
MAKKSNKINEKIVWTKFRLYSALLSVIYVFVKIFKVFADIQRNLKYINYLFISLFLRETHSGQIYIYLF